MAREKIKFGLRISPETQKLVRDLYPRDNCQSQNEFIEKAIRFYAGYLMGNAASDFLPQALVSAIRGTLQDSENRTARLLFKLAVELRDVWFRYERDGADVLRGTTLAVPEGSLFAVVGGNGTGKSTMLRAICGVARPYRGKITVLGRRLKEWKKAELFRGGVALLPQDPLNLMVKKTVRGDLEEMLDGRGLTAEQRVAAVGEVATLTDIAPLLDAHPFDLSGGEVQRAVLAKVLLCEPRLLLLDEPTKGLDAFFKDKLARLLRSLTARGTTVLMVSHDVEFCASYADWCALFFDGNVVTTNPPRQFFASNSFYTTAANRISRGFFENVVTVEEVVELCRS